MAEGIVKRHSRSCRSREGRRCSCRPSYEAWVSLTRGGSPTKVRKTFRNEAEAKSWRTDALAAANRGALRPIRRDSRTLAEALEQFVQGMSTGEVRPRRRGAYKPATVRSYEQSLRVRIAEARLGRMRVAEIQRPDVQAFADDLLAAGLAASTVSNTLNPIQAFYRRAIDRGELALNPSARVDVPEPTSRSPRIVSKNSAGALVAALPLSDRAVWATAFYAGLRRGELQALRWSDVDLGRSEIRVERSWDQYEGPQAPKSESSRRTVPMLAVLRDHLDELKLRTGREGDALVFGRTASAPFVSSTVDRTAQDAWTGAKLSTLTLHECRHTFASLLIDAGANPKAVQTFMGHSKIQTTFDTYGHLFPGSRDEVRERMDAYLEVGEEAVSAA